MVLECDKPGRARSGGGHGGCIIASMPIDSSRETLLASLKIHSPADAIEAGHLARIVEFVTRERAPFSRETESGHITASALIVDPTRARALMIWHEKLQRWLQPGGHCETSDADVLAAAFREVREETDLGPGQVYLVSDGICDVDAHRIPARGITPEHWHFDIRFLMEASDQHKAVPATRWVSLARLQVLPDPSLKRLAAKAIHAG